MRHNTAWIVSDDRDLASDIAQKLERLRDCDVGVSSSAEWLDGDVAAERPQWLVFDLRRSQPLAAPLWPDLANARQRTRHLPGTPLTCLGILDAGYPIAEAKTAERHLAGYCAWPMTDEAWSNALVKAERKNVEFDRNGNAECREVRSKSYVFRTYTPSLFRLFDLLETVARHEFSVLIVGETGTGKTTLAGMIHELSPRRDKRFLTVACGALPGDLIDSELFGHVRGAFTGADRPKSGKFEAAEEGTILLDEIDVLGMLQQAKLLRVLETGEYEPIGSNDTKVARCRTIVASNVKLESLMERHQFRADLYYRLNQVKFEIPPLRSRPADIVPLAVDFIDECRREHGLPVHSIHPDLLSLLRNYAWPGNIRELRHEVRRCVLFSRDGVVTPEALSLGILEAAQGDVAGTALPLTGSSLANEVAVTERDSIEEMLRRQNYNRAATARALGISRVTLYNKIRKYQIRLDEVADAEE